MTTVAVVGLGDVGANTARQLVDTPGIDRVILIDRRSDVADTVRQLLRSDRVSIGDARALPRDCDAFLCSLPGDRDVAVAEHAIEIGAAFASVADDADSITQLLALDTAAVDAGVMLAIGCGFAPGLSDVLARHAANAMDVLEEVHVARAGAAGPESVATVRDALRRNAVLSREGSVREVRPRGHELVWFPEPVRSRDCTLVASGVALLTRSFPETQRITVRFSDVQRRNWWSPAPPLDAQWGAIRVECWGRRNALETPLTYGCVARTGVVAGTMLALTGAALVGALPLLRSDAPHAGAHGLGALLDPVPTLHECATRGISVAAFEGLASATERR
jgi:hypothetical protein